MGIVLQVFNEEGDKAYVAAIEPHWDYCIQVDRSFVPTWADYPEGTHCYSMSGATLVYLADKLGWKLIGANCPPDAECPFDFIWRTPDQHRVNVMHVDFDGAE